jgi:hypothetical protein
MSLAQLWWSLPSTTGIQHTKTMIGSVDMAEFYERDLHPVKKALAIAVLAIERMPGPFQSGSDMADMKGLLDRFIESDVEIEHYARAALIAVTGEAPKNQ